VHRFGKRLRFNTAELDRVMGLMQNGCDA